VNKNTKLQTFQPENEHVSCTESTVTQLIMLRVIVTFSFIEVFPNKRASTSQSRNEEYSCVFRL